METRKQKRKKREGREREERKKGEKREKEKEIKAGRGEKRREMGKASERDCIFIITVDWLGLRATSYLLVFPFYITTNLLLISYY